MRVVIVSDFGDVTGGAAKVAITSARGLAERGIRVVFVCAIEPVSERLDHPGIDVHRLDLAEVWSRRNPLGAAYQGIWNAAAAGRLADLLRNEDPAGTVVHFHQWTKALSPSVIDAAGRSGLGSVISLHDYFLCCPNGAYFRFPRGEPCRLKPLSAGCIAANCDSRNYGVKAVRLARQAVLARVLARREQAPQSVIHVSPFARTVAEPLLPSGIRHFVVPNPVDVAKRSPVEVHNNDRFVFIGRFTPEKRCVAFARAAQEAGVPATFLGEGPEEPAIRAAHPGAHILPWGSAAAVERVLSEARALVFPSAWYETSGLVVAEALARGVPAIVSRATGARDLIRDGVNGLLCPPDEPDGLVGCLRHLEDDDVAHRMGANAFALYWDDPPSVEAHLDRLLATYSSILAAPEGASANRPAHAAESAQPG